MQQSRPDKLTHVPDSTSMISMLSAELSLASHRGRVGSDVNSHLSMIAAAALREHSEIGPILERHGFRQGEFRTQLSSKDMEAIVQDLVLTNSLNIWFAEEASKEWPQFLRGLRAHLLKASNSIHIEPRVIKHLGELTTIALDVHPEIRSILAKYGPLQGNSADRLYTGLSSEGMFALANDLLPTIHAEVTTTELVEDTEETVQWRYERVIVMVMEHEGKPLNKPGIITFVHSDEDYTVKMMHNFQQIAVSATNMTRMDIHKGNQIIIISGPHKGKIGQIDEILDEDGLIKLIWLPDGNAIPDDIDSIQILDMWRLCLCGSKRDERKHPTRGESEYLGSVEPAELGLHLDFSHDTSENERQLHICFTAEYTVGSLNGRDSPDRMGEVCTFLQPLGLQFIHVYGQAHISCLLPGSQAARLMDFQQHTMLTAISRVSVAAMKYDEIVALVNGAVRPVTLSFVYDQFNTFQNLSEYSSSDEDEPASLFYHFCHWHRACTKGCMNRYSMEIFEKSGYVYDNGNVYTTSHFMRKWGATTARWSLRAAPAYKIIIGTYTSGLFRNHEHVMYTLDESGHDRVPHDTGMGKRVTNLGSTGMLCTARIQMLMLKNEFDAH